jgi:acyl-CoA thioester hydrolase
MALPTYAQILQLGTVSELVVGPEHLDINDHMTVTQYLDIAAHGMRDAYLEFGLGGEQIEIRGQTVFTAEHHLRYYSELRAGTPISVHSRLLGRSQKAMHAISFIVDAREQVLSCTLELSAVNMDFGTRRPTDFPDDSRPKMDALIAQHERLDWEAPVCGAMNLRNPVTGF